MSVEIEKPPVWMVQKRAFGGEYWEHIYFGPFDTREEADAFVEQGTHGLFHGGYVIDANKEPIS